jgi:hypothetical protein
METRCAVSDNDQIELTCPRCQKRMRVPRSRAGQQVRCANPSCPAHIEVPQPGAPQEDVPLRYPVLRFFVSLYQLLAAGAGVGALVSVVLGVLGVWSLLAAVYNTAGCLLACVTCLAFAELIKVGLAIEYHTRVIRQKLDRTRD